MSDWLVYLAVLLAALAHAGWNYLIKASSDAILTTGGMRLFGFLMGAGLLVVLPWPNAEVLPYLAGQVGFACVYYYFLLNSYRVGEFSSVYPIARGIAPISVLLATSVMQIDSLSSTEITATLAISLGIVLLSTKLRDQPAALLYAIATGLMIAVYTFFAGVGIRHLTTSHWSGVVGYLAMTEVLIGSVIVPVCWFLRRNQVRVHFAAHWPTLIFTAGLSMGGFGIVLWAFQYLPLGPVTAVRETSVAFAVLFGVYFLREPLGRSKFAALALIVAGVMLLALSH